MIKVLIITAVILFSSSVFSQSYQIKHLELTDNSKKLNYEFALTYPALNSFNGEIGNVKMFNDFMKKKAYALRDTFRVWMKDWETPSETKDIQSYYEAGDSVFYANGNLISILFYEGYYFSGAAHPNNSSFSVNYNMDTHKEVTLNDILLPGWEKTISEICIADITRQKKELGITPDEWLNDGAEPKAENFEVFNITKDHLLITFPTYQVGSYAEGPSEVEIPYENIKQLFDKSGLMPGFAK